MANENEQIAADGTVWQHGPRAPMEGASLPAHDDEADPSAVLVLPEDIVGVRGIERLEPPFDEEWVVVTFAVRRDVGRARTLRLQMGGTERSFPIEDPPALIIADPVPAAEAAPAVPVAPSPATVTLQITDTVKVPSDAVIARASADTPAPAEKG